jgi:hypothetical protein
MALPHHASNFFASNQRFFSHDFTLIASVMVESIIGHGIGGINFPDKMARFAKIQDHWSKQRQTLCVTRSRGRSNQYGYKRSTYVDVMYYREFLTYRISTTSSVEVSYKLLVSYELLRSHDVHSRT